MAALQLVVLLALCVALLATIAPARAATYIPGSVNLADWANGTLDMDAVRRALVPQPDFLKLNAALDNVKFGPNPGPCPNSANKCFTRFADMPDWIKNSQVTIGDRTRALKDWVKQGDFYVWNFACDDMQVDFINVAHLGQTTSGGNTLNGVRMAINDLKLNCFGNTEFKNLKMDARVKIGVGWASFWTTVEVTGQGTANVVMSKAGMNGEEAGIGVETNFDVFRTTRPAGQEEPPKNIKFRAARTGCLLSISNGFQLTNQNLNLGGLIGFLANLFPGLVSGIMRDVTKTMVEDIMCGVLKGSAYTNTAETVLGPVNEFLRDRKVDLDGYKAAGVRVRSQFQADDNNIASSLSNLGSSSTWTDFSTDELFEAVSVGLNEYLGSDSEEPGYTGKPVINEIVDVLNGDTTGVLDLPDIAATFELSSLPSFEFGEDVTRNTMKLKGVRLEGLNTFNTFQALDNGFADPGTFGARYKRTLLSAVNMDVLNMEFTFDMTMSPGNWVTAGGRTQRFVFSMEAQFTDLDISAATYVLLQQDNLLNLQVGQLIGESQELIDAYNCALRGIDHFRFSGLQASAGTVDLAVVNFFDLGSLISNIVDLANILYQPVIKRDLPAIADNFLRVEANDYLDNTFFRSALPACPLYVPIAYAGGARWFNLKENLGTDFVSNVVDNLIGGQPILRNSLDINSIIQATLRYLVFDRPDGAINNDPNSVYTFDNPSDGVWNVREKVDVLSQVGADYLRLEIKGPAVTSLDSIFELEVTDSPLNDYTLGFNFKWGNGYLRTQQGGPLVYAPYLGLELPIALDSAVNGFVYANEDFTFRLQLQLEFEGAVEARILKNEVYLTRARDLLELQCALATLESKDLANFQINLVNFTFGMVFTGAGQTGFSNTPVGVAMEAWRVKLSNAQSRATTEYFLNFIIDRLQNETINIFNKDFVPPYTRTACLTQESPLTGTLFDSPVPVPNLTAINEFLEEATTYQDPPFGDPASDWEKPLVNGESAFDLTQEENLFVAALAAVITPTTVRDVIYDLSSTEPDPLNPSILDPVYRILFLEADNSTSLRVDPNTITNVNFEPDTEGLIPGLKLRLTQIELTNLDAFTSLDALLPYVDEDGKPAQFTTYNTIVYGNNSMTLTIKAEVEVGAIVFNASALPGELLKDTIDISLNITGLDVRALLAVAVDKDKLATSTMGEIVFFNETRHAFQVRPDAYNCTIKRVVYEDGIYFPMLQANVTDIEGPAVAITTNFFGEEAKNVIVVLVEMFVAVFRKQIPNLTQGPLRKEVNAIFSEIIAEASNVDASVTNCTGVEYPSYNSTGGVRTFNFTRSAFGPDLQALLDVDLLNPNSAININALLARFINDVDFFLQQLNGTQIPLNGDYGGYDFEFGGFRIEKLGTGGVGDAEVTSMTILDNTPFGGEQPFMTRSTFQTDGDFEVSFRLRYAFDKLFVDSTDGGSGARRQLADTAPVLNDLRIGVRLTAVDVSTNMTTRVDINNILDLTAADALGLYDKPVDALCLLKIFEDEGLVFEDFKFTAELLRLTLRCEGECSSPMFETLNEFGIATSNQTSVDLTDGFNDIVNLAVALAGQSSAQKYINGAIKTAKGTCNFEPGEQSVSSGSLTDAASIMGYAGVGVAGGALAGAFFLLPTHRRRRNQIMAIAFNRLNGNDGRIALKGEHLLLIERKLKSLFRHPAVPRAGQLGVPVVIVTVIALFLAANLNTVGATVLVTIALAGDVTQPLGVLTFTLASSINDMWNAGTYPLALIIFIASGVWPHTKSMLLLFSWFSPPTVLAQKRRGHMLEVLDALGKWSLIDAYVLIMLQVAFRFYITSSYVTQLDFLDPDAFVVDVLVKPGASIYLFVCATMLALVVNHYMIFQHRRALAADQALEDRVNNVQPPQLANSKRAVMRHVFLVPDRRNILYGFSSGTKLAAGSLLSLGGLLVAVGSFLPMITFKFGGVGGTILGVVRPDLAERTYSAVSIALAIRDGIDAGDVATQSGVVFLQMVYLVFTLITPLALLTLLAVLWFRPLTAGDQMRLLFVTEIVAAWEALLVLLVAILAAAAEVSQLAQFVIKAATGTICERIVAPLLFLGVPEESAVCFDVSASIEPSGSILIAGSLLTVMAAAFMFRVLTPAIHDRHLQRTGRLDKDGRCPKLAEGFWPNEVVLRNAVQPVSRIRASPVDAQVAPGFDDDDGFAEAAAPASRAAFNPAFKPDIDV